MTDPVLLVGSAGDSHITAVKQGLSERGVEAVIVDTLNFPDSPSISLGHRLDDITINERPLGRPAAIYIRDVYVHPLAFGVDVADEMQQDWRRTLIAFREKASLLMPMLARWTELGVPTYNPVSSDWRLAKTLQLSLLERAGLPVPQTVWTNDPERVKAFASGRRVAYKPVAGGAATQELGPEDLTDDRLNTLRGAPVTFQELLEGDNYRVYCLDDEIVATIRVDSAALDYRQHEEALEKVDLDPEVLEQCLFATKLLGLRWSGIDLRSDRAGTLRFLELNTSPMFLGFDRGAGSNILEALVERLAEHADYRAGS